MAPLARGTAFVDMLREKAVCDAGANAEVRVAKVAKRATTEAFIVIKIFGGLCGLWLWGVLDFWIYFFYVGSSDAEYDSVMTDASKDPT